MERRLAAILSADVVGYSRLMEDDEAATLIALQAHRRDIIEPTVALFNGRIVDFVGDNFLAEFATVVDAVVCAVTVQSELSARNADIPEHRRLLFRMGVNLGDVIAEGGRIYGDGVNVAARLETLADPGGVYLSRAAHDQVRDKLDLTFEDLDEIEVKNIARPIRVYRVSPDAFGVPMGSTSAKRKSNRAPAIAAIAAVILITVGIASWQLRTPGNVPVVQEQGGSGQSTQDAAKNDKQDAIGPNAVQTAMEVTYWNLVRDSGDPALIGTYLEKFPGGQFIAFARAEIANIEAQAAAARAEAERRRKAAEEAAAAAQHEALMEAEARRLAEAKEEEKRRALAALRARQKTELADWEAVRNTENAMALERFLSKHPNGTFSDLARAKLKVVRHQRQVALEAEAASATSKPLYELGLILKIQQHLVRLGCYRGRPDGKWGVASREAVERYARHSMLQLASRDPSPDLLEVLGNRKPRVCP